MLLHLARLSDTCTSTCMPAFLCNCDDCQWGLTSVWVLTYSPCYIHECHKGILSLCMHTYNMFSYAVSVISVMHEFTCTPVFVHVHKSHVSMFACRAVLWQAHWISEEPLLRSPSSSRPGPAQSTTWVWGCLGRTTLSTLVAISALDRTRPAWGCSHI